MMQSLESDENAVNLVIAVTTNEILKFRQICNRLKARLKFIGFCPFFTHGLFLTLIANRVLLRLKVVLVA